MSHPRSQITSGHLVDTREKQAEALRLRREGYSLSEIGIAMSCSGQYAGKLIRNGLKEIIREPAKQVIQLELERLDVLWQKAFVKVAHGQASKESIEVCLKVMERRARLLGLDKPAKIAHTDEDGNGLPQVPTFVVNPISAEPKDITPPPDALEMENPDE